MIHVITHSRTHREGKPVPPYEGGSKHFPDEPYIMWCSWTDEPNTITPRCGISGEGSSWEEALENLWNNHPEQLELI